MRFNLDKIVALGWRKLMLEKFMPHYPWSCLIHILILNWLGVNKKISLDLQKYIIDQDGGIID